MQNSSGHKAYGTVSSRERALMTGLQFVGGLVDGTLPLNRMAATLGYDIVEAEVGRVVIVAEPKEDHLNPWGTVHGGLAATLLDSCMGLAVQTSVDMGVMSTTVEFKISFVRPITIETGAIRAQVGFSVEGDSGNRRRPRAFVFLRTHPSQSHRTGSAKLR